VSAELHLLCPSAQPDMEGAKVIGVVGGSTEEPLVSYLTEPQPVSNELLALSKPVEPTEVFRFAAPCVGDGCQHFDGSNCRLAAKVSVTRLTTISRLPPCRIRPACRWWSEQGRTACMRCPFIVTTTYAPPDDLRAAADPAVSVEGSKARQRLVDGARCGERVEC